MNKLYMGIDAGGVFVKGVIIDEYDNIITSCDIENMGDPVSAVKKLILRMKEDIDLEKYKVVSVGVTGSARKLIGILLGGQVIKNEITALSIGTIRMYPDVRTIIDIGGEDSKIIIVNDGVVIDYGISNSCNTGCGSFIDTIAKKMRIDINLVSDLSSKGNAINITNNCIVFAESNLINKIQEGYKKEDILAGVCNAISQNYVNTVAKGKKILSPIVFCGGVSKNLYIVKCLEKLFGENIIVNKNSYLMSAIGIAIMARNSGLEHVFDFNIEAYNVETRLVNCINCSNNCEIINVYKNDNLIDMWGNKCDKVEKNV